jgi:hypothetical protein
MTNPQTTGEKALAFIDEAISKKLTVYIHTQTRITKISPSTVKSWTKKGDTLFKLADDGGLLMASGKNFVRLSTPSSMLVGLTAE